MCFCTKKKFKKSVLFITNAEQIGSADQNLIVKFSKIWARLEIPERRLPISMELEPWHGETGGKCINNTSGRLCLIHN